MSNELFSLDITHCPAVLYTDAKRCVADADGLVGTVIADVGVVGIDGRDARCRHRLYHKFVETEVGRSVVSPLAYVSGLEREVDLINDAER